MSHIHWTRLVRFVPKSDPNTILIGQPGNGDIDVGIATREGKDVAVTVFSGSSILSPGEATSRTETVERLLSPLALSEVNSIRCIGLNYRQHANELSLPMPTVPTVFLKPATALADPYPEPTILPYITQKDDCGDYESELAVILSGSCKNVSEEDAMDYVLGYTAANDVSSRTSQFEQSQWTYSKGFDGSCPIGPCVVSTKAIPDPSKLKVRGLKNGECLQECGTDDLIFSIPKLISFLSQGTTLPAGTLIITGTPAGVGTSHKPAITIKDGDEFHVEILPHIGTLVNVFQNEQ